MSKIVRLNLISMAGLVLVVGGLIGIVLGGYLYFKATDGLESLDAVYAAQGRTLTYDADGNFTDRGTKAGGDAILSLLEDEWKYPLNRANLDPDDPMVNTPDELMVSYAIISYHTLHGTVTVTLPEDVEYQGVLYRAGTYEVPTEGKYFSDFDRNHPLEGRARDLAWSPLAFGLLGQLIGGVNADYQAGMAHFMSWSIFVGLGFMFTVAGVFVFFGGIQLARRAEAEVKVKAAAPAPTPAAAGRTAAPAHQG
jgi:hypothetical protein